MFFFTSAAVQSFFSLLVARRERRWIAPALLVSILAGCATGDIAMLVPVSGGEKVRVPVGRGGTKPTEIEGFEVPSPQFTLSDEKTRLIYSFQFSDRKRRALRSVRVEDISDAKPLLLVEDEMPALTDGHWRGVSRPVSPSEDGLKWLYSIDNTVRVFRFTIITADGRSVVANQGAMFPNGLKSAVRHTFGEKY